MRPPRPGCGSGSLASVPTEQLEDLRELLAADLAEVDVSTDLVEHPVRYTGVGLAGVLVRALWRGLERVDGVSHRGCRDFAGCPGRFDREASPRCSG